MSRIINWIWKIIKQIIVVWRPVKTTAVSNSLLITMMLKYMVLVKTSNNKCNRTSLITKTMMLMCSKICSMLKKLSIMSRTQTRCMIKDPSATTCSQKRPKLRYLEMMAMMNKKKMESWMLRLTLMGSKRVMIKHWALRERRRMMLRTKMTTTHLTRMS